MVLIWTHAVGDIKDHIAATRLRDMLCVEHAGVGRNKTGQRFKERGLAGAIWPNDANDFARRCDKGDILYGDLISIPLTQSGDFDERC